MTLERAKIVAELLPAFEWFEGVSNADGPQTVFSFDENGLNLRAYWQGTKEQRESDAYVPYAHAGGIIGWLELEAQQSKGHTTSYVRSLVERLHYKVTPKSTALTVVTQ